MRAEAWWNSANAGHAAQIPMLDHQQTAEPVSGQGGKKGHGGDLTAVVWIILLTMPATVAAVKIEHGPPLTIWFSCQN